MKIVMDFRKYDGVVGGVERGVIEVSRYVARNGHEVVMLAKEHRLDEVKGLFTGLTAITFHALPVRTHVMSRQNARLDATGIQDIAEREGADVIHFPYNWSFPTRKKRPTVLTVHDVIPFTFREAMALYQNLFLYKPGIRKACRLNDVVTTVSVYSKQDIVRKVGVPPEKIRVIPNGLRVTTTPDESRDEELKTRFGLEDGFIMDVGGIHERKNIVRLVEAFARFVKRENYSGKLVITGNVSGAPYQEKMKALCDGAVRDARLEGQVLFTGFISDEELDSLFRLCEFLVYPSLYEGFGIPVLEAMQAGTPVITSNATAMPEVAGEAAIRIDPTDVSAIAEAMSRLLQDSSLREELVTKGLERAKAFSWERTAEMYLDLYREVRERFS